ILTNFLRLIFDIGISLLAKNSTVGVRRRKRRDSTPEGKARALRATTSMIGPRRRMHRRASKERSRGREKYETCRPRRPSQEAMKASAILLLLLAGCCRPAAVPV